MLGSFRIEITLINISLTPKTGLHLYKGRIFIFTIKELIVTFLLSSPKGYIDPRLLKIKFEPL